MMSMRTISICPQDNWMVQIEPLAARVPYMVAVGKSRLLLLLYVHVIAFYYFIGLCLAISLSLSFSFPLFVCAYVCLSVNWRA